MRKISALFFIIIFLQGCASIVSQSSYPLTVTTVPAGAEVIISDAHGVEIFKAQSPATVKLEAGDGFFKRAKYQVLVRQLGYQDKIIPVQFKMDGWYWGNILFGGFIGMLIIDPATGAMFKIDSEYLLVTLSASNAQASPQLQIYDLEHVPKHLKSRLIKIN